MNPNLTRDFADLSSVSGLQAGSFPKAGPWGRSGLQNHLVCPVVVAGGLFSRSVNTLVSPGCVH